MVLAVVIELKWLQNMVVHPHGFFIYNTCMEWESEVDLNDEPWFVSMYEVKLNMWFYNKHCIDCVVQFCLNSEQITSKSFNSAGHCYY